MVRTLVFHTNNVGSIPTGLKMIKQLNGPLNPLQTLQSKRPYVQKLTIRYSFRFKSLIPPSTLNYTETARDSQSLSHSLPKRLLLKKSYLLVSWINYLTIIGTQHHKSFKPYIAFLPADTRTYTLTKAPMAHKTNSKEQFLIKFYNFKFSFELRPNPVLIPTSISEGAYVLVLTKKLFPVFETNLISLKYYQIVYPILIKKTLQSLVPLQTQSVS